MKKTAIVAMSILLSINTFAANYDEYIEEIEVQSQTLLNDVKEVSKDSKKMVIPANVSSNNFLDIEFGYKQASMSDENNAFSINALDNSALNIKGNYGQYFTKDEFFVTAGFAFLQLKQANLKNINTSVNWQSNIDDDLDGFIGVKAGVSYLTWDITLDEASVSTTSTSPLFGIHAGLEYKIDEKTSIMLIGEYTRYSHKTQIPNGTLTLDSDAGVFIGFKFYL